MQELKLTNCSIYLTLEMLMCSAKTAVSTYHTPVTEELVNNLGSYTRLFHTMHVQETPLTEENLSLIYGGVQYLQDCADKVDYSAAHTDRNIFGIIDSVSTVRYILTDTLMLLKSISIDNKLGI